METHPDDTAARDHLATALRRIRENMHLSQLDIADQLGVHHGSVSRLERDRTWKICTLQAWARWYGHRITVDIDGLDIPDDDDQMAAIYAAQTPDTAAEEDLLDLRILANNITRIRRAQGISLVEMGRRLGCTSSSVSHRESRPDGMLVTTGQRYVRALGGVLRLGVLNVVETP